MSKKTFSSRINGIMKTWWLEIKIARLGLHNKAQTIQVQFDFAIYEITIAHVFILKRLVVHFITVGSRWTEMFVSHRQFWITFCFPLLPVYFAYLLRDMSLTNYSVIPLLLRHLCACIQNGTNQFCFSRLLSLFSKLQSGQLDAAVVSRILIAAWANPITP